MDKNENYNKKGFYTVLYTLAAVFIILAFGICILNSGNKSNNNEANLEENISLLTNQILSHLQLQKLQLM